MNKNYYEGIPVVPLRGLVVFPYTYVSFDVGRDMSVAAIEAASNNGGTIFLVAQKDQKLSEITKDNLSPPAVYAGLRISLSFPEKPYRSPSAVYSVQSLTVFLRKNRSLPLTSLLTTMKR